MNKLKGSFAAKLIAVLLLCALAVVCVLAAAGTAYLSGMGAYTVDLAEAEEQALKNAASTYLDQAGEAWREGKTQPQFLDTGFRYTILSADGEELFSTYEGGETRWTGSQLLYPRFYVEHREDTERPDAVTPTPRPVTPSETETAAPTPQPRNVIRIFCYDDGQEYDFASDVELIRWENARALTVKGYLLQAEGPDEFDRALNRLDQLYACRILLPAAAAISFVLGLLLFLFLLAAAGHRDESGAVTESFADRIPLDLFTLLIGAGIFLALGLAFGVGLPDNIIGYAVGILLLLAVGLLLLLWCMSFAVRVKRGTLWQNCLLARLWRFCVRLLREAWRLLLRGLRALPALWRWVLILGGVLLLELLILWSGADDGGSVIWCIQALVLSPLFLVLVWSMRRLRLGAKEIAAGNMAYTIDTRGLFWELKDHAEDLNHIRDGINAAVAERMRSEHFQSELIANVSHDIKTPLTSIINYVDLLEKEELGSETAREYVGVLARQSARLKKLLDDLLEASKASTGVLAVVPERLDLAVLLDQCAGEYGERLSNAGLELVRQKPEEPVPVMADGRHMWRIFDNLLGNIVKYALPGTRVYLTLAREGDAAVVSFRNISREPLQRSAEELMERFVRGDSARNTEGSGLGLAIARSLALLQGGEMTLSMDGDLFKVVLTFPLAKQA